MKLTTFAKVFITLVVLGVIAYAGWHYKGASIRKWAGAEGGGPAKEATGGEAVATNDFDALKNAPADPGRLTNLYSRLA